MAERDILKDRNFKEVAEVRADSKNRITLGKKSWSIKSKIYKVYRNSLGQIILDPLATIPAYEQWLFKNKEAVRLVQAGLEDMKKGRLVNAREDYSNHIDED